MLYAAQFQFARLTILLVSLCHQLSSVAPQNKVRILLGFIIAQSFRTEAQFEQLARFLFGCDTGQLNVLAALIIYLDTPHRTEGSSMV